MFCGNIIVTGFGPFGEHKVNASWESVKLLPDEIENFKIIKEEIPVSYQTVDKKIKTLWQEYKPKLVIHVGVSSYTDKITLETCAHKEGYFRVDHFGKSPLNGHKCSVESTDECIQVGINVKDICDYLNTKCNTQACISENAGRYLCEYTFYTSLGINKDSTMFIHVPPLQKPYSAKELAEILFEIIKCALNQR